MNIAKKFIHAFTPPALLAVIALIALLVLCLLPAAKADTQGLPSTTLACTNVPPTLPPNWATNFVSIIPLHNYSGLALETIINAASNSANVGIFLSPSVDGTNFDTRPWPWVVTLNGPTNVVATTNWDVNRLRGYQAIAITGMTNGGGATITNFGFTFNRPNN